MGVSFQIFVLSITLIYGIGHTVDAIKCWECRSDVDPHCADPFDNSTFPIMECKLARSKLFVGVESTMCQKIKRKEDGVWKVIRKCAFAGEVGTETWDGMSTPRYEPNNVYSEYYTCKNRDGCNTSVKVFATLWSMVLLVIPLISL
ncbi:hypothetical protein FQR65_LT01853 [Abscondita terminalis]|nr:hypothetical protein FQR65_LT01853 [Abscondita terminalis]